MKQQKTRFPAAAHPSTDRSGCSSVRPASRVGSGAFLVLAGLALLGCAGADDEDWLEPRGLPGTPPSSSAPGTGEPATSAPGNSAMPSNSAILLIGQDTTGYVANGNTDVVELHPEGIVNKFHLSGFLLGLERLR